MDGWMRRRRRHSRAVDVLLPYDDDDVANDDDDDSGGEGDFCASGDATKRTRVCVEAIDDDDAPPQVRTHYLQL